MFAVVSIAMVRSDHCLSKQYVHVLESAAFRLRIKEINDLKTEVSVSQSLFSRHRPFFSIHSKATFFVKGGVFGSIKAPMPAGSYRNASQIDGHEEEVNPRPNILDAHGPHLGNNYRSDGTSRCSKVETAGSNGRREDLFDSVSIIKDPTAPWLNAFAYTRGCIVLPPIHIPRKQDRTPCCIQASRRK